MEFKLISLLSIISKFLKRLLSKPELIFSIFFTIPEPPPMKKSLWLIFFRLI